MKKNKAKYGYIYKVENRATGEVYIGATGRSVEERKKDHEQKAQKEEHSCFQEAIATYGPDAFSWEQIDTANDANELAKKEQEYIFKYKTQSEGFNIDRGGGIKKNIYQYRIDDKRLIGCHESLEEAAKAVNAKRTSISNACLGYLKSCKGYYWSYVKSDYYDGSVDKRKKKVLQLALPGWVKATYNSVADASKATGVSKTCIARCCRGERKQSGGFRWAYKE